MRILIAITFVLLALVLVQAQHINRLHKLDNSLDVQKALSVHGIR